MGETGPAAGFRAPLRQGVPNTVKPYLRNGSAQCGSSFNGVLNTVAEKTKRPNKGSGRSPARKPAAKQPGARASKKPATAADELDAPAAKKTAKKSKQPATARKSGTKKAAARKSTAKSARRPAAKDATAAPKSEEKLESPIDSKEALAERRIAGGQDTESPTPSANENRPPAEAPANPSPQNPKQTRPETRVRPGESAESEPRPDILVPTNGIHTTERRIKRRLHQNRGVMALIAATLVGIFILGGQTTPPDMSEFERQIAAGQAGDRNPGAAPAYSPASSAPGIVQPRVEFAAEAAPNPAAGAPAHDPGADRFPGAHPWVLDAHELAEMERLLARLDLGPSTADGIVDQRTETAIRLYQEIAGLPVNGAPSRALLADMREVTEILDNGG